MNSSVNSCPENYLRGCSKSHNIKKKIRNRRLRNANFVRVPGLFRRWEVEDLLTTECNLQIEPGGSSDDGTPLYMVFRREGRCL
jgi:hypothetical protein